MMSDAFFLPRTTLLEWLQSEFDCRIDRVEQCGNGAMYLQIIDRLFPGVVNMKRVKWDATTSYDMVKNYKSLQEAFKQCGLNREFNLESLSRCRCQDNLEFLQWMRALWDRRITAVKDLPYNAWERRSMSMFPLPEWAKSKSQQQSGILSGGVISERCMPERVPLPFAGNSGRLPPNSFRNPSAMPSASPPTSASKIPTRPEASEKLRTLAEQLSNAESTIKELRLENEFLKNKLKVIERYCSASPEAHMDKGVVLTILSSKTFIDEVMDIIQDEGYEQENMSATSSLAHGLPPQKLRVEDS